MATLSIHHYDYTQSCCTYSVTDIILETQKPEAPITDISDIFGESLSRVLKLV